VEKLARKNKRLFMISKSLKKYLITKLNKSDEEELDEEDFNKIEEISINLKNISDEEEDYDFKDFLLFKNLKFLSIQNFKIRNFETNIINRISNLKAVQMTNCKISSRCSLTGNLELISFHNCKNFKLDYIRNLKKLKVLKISGYKRINLKGISNLKNIEKLYFRNTKLEREMEILNLQNLDYINLTESKYKQKLEDLLPKSVKIEKEL
jgi:hypothetical protein